MKRTTMILMLLLLMVYTVGCTKTEFKTIKKADGSVYVGQAIDDIPNGKGKLTLKDGRIYEGQFKDGKLNGQGSIRSNKTTDIEKGQYKDGKLNGKGERVTQIGSERGTFKDGMLNGYAYSSDDIGIYYGNYKNGALIGDKVTIDFENGDKYVGQLKDGMMSGSGTLVYANKCKYVGEFIKDKPSGNGKYFLADGTEVEFSELAIREQLGIAPGSELNRTQTQFVNYFVFMSKTINEIKPLYSDIVKLSDKLKNNGTLSNEDYEQLLSLDTMLKSKYEMINSVYTPLSSIELCSYSSKDVALGSMELIYRGVGNILAGLDRRRSDLILTGRMQVSAGSDSAFNNDANRPDINERLDYEIEFSKRFFRP